MKTKKLVSVIVPVYNTERFLSKCIKSIINQTYRNIELIMVVDASPDNSIKVINRFKQKDDRIKLLVNRENRGVDFSRFEGIRQSSGDYLFFIDSDDWIPANAIEVLYNKNETENADIVFGSFNKTIDKFGIIKRKGYNNYGKRNLIESIVQPDLFEEYFISYFGVNKLFVSMWGKLYRKDTVLKANLQPSFMKMGEDLIFNLKLHPHLTKIAFVKDTVYCYRWGGLTNKHNPTFLKDIKVQYCIKKEAIVQYNYEKALPYTKYELSNCFYSHFRNLLLLDKKHPKEVRFLIEEELNDDIYDELESIQNSSKAKNIYFKNIDAIVNTTMTEYAKQKNRYRVKKLISSILS